MNLLEQLAADARLRVPPQPACQLSLLISPSPQTVTECLRSFPSFCRELEKNLKSLRPNHEWESLEEAVAELGPIKLLQLVWRITLLELFGSALPVYGMTEKQFWRHTLAVSLAAEQLWNETSVVEEDLTTTLEAAWLHDIGKLYINSALQTRPEFLVNYIRSERFPIPVGEQALLGASHAQLGAKLLTMWGLPAAVVGAVEHHHQPDLSKNTALAFLLLLSDVCAHGMGEAFGWSAMAPANINELLDGVGVDWTQLEKALAVVTQRMKEPF